MQQDGRIQALFFIEAHGKADAWSRILRDLGIHARVVATGGHICRFPDTLFPIGVDMTEGRPLDPMRRLDPDSRSRLLDAIAAVPESARIIIAMDSDVEGDVIAFDTINAVLSSRPETLSRLWRLYPGAITRAGIKRAIANAEPVARIRDRIIDAAIQGRARAVSDRWIGATFSRHAGLPVGRVKTAMTGLAYLWHRAPDHTRGRPETGEVLLQARSTTGGRPFLARVPFDGTEDPAWRDRLVSITQRFRSSYVPGQVRRLEPAGAAIAPRFGHVTPFNTGQALIHAARHCGIKPGAAMRGLQSAYMQGRISYPRTESTSYSAETAGHVARLARSCRVPGSAVENLPVYDPNANDHTIHEGLHPVMELTPETIQEVRRTLSTNLAKIDPRDPDDVCEAMVALVFRRSFEATRNGEMEPGNWAPDNMARAKELDDTDIMILRQLEWVREVMPAVPWGRDIMTGVRDWPFASQIIEGMMREEIGRPSTYASHAAALEASGDIDAGSLDMPPRPTPSGITVLKRTPKAIRSPRTCRLIEAALQNRGNHLCEDPQDVMQERMRYRIASWFDRLPEDVQAQLLSALGSEDNQVPSWLSQMSLDDDISIEADADVMDFSDTPQQPDQPVQ